MLGTIACAPQTTAPTTPAATDASAPSAAPAADPVPAPGVTLVHDFTIEPYRTDGAAQTGTPSRFSSLFDGRPVVLNFWGGSCPPCRAEMPDFDAVARTNVDAVRFVGIDLGEPMGLGDEAQGRALVAELGVDYFTGRAEDGDGVIDAYGVQVMPTTVFFRASGEVLAARPGALSRAELEQSVALLREADGR